MSSDNIVSKLVDVGKAGGRKIKSKVTTMALHKKPLVPDYIYSSRVKDSDVAYFERQYFRASDSYAADVKETKERFEYATRIGYTFFADLRRAVEAGSPTIKKLSERVTFLGNKGYDWGYIPGLINKNSTLYGFGVGTDISFEVELGKAHNCPVHVFDPTPQSIEYAVKIGRAEPLINFYPYGLLSRDALAKFYKPNEHGLGSLSVTNLHFGDAYIDAPVMRLTTIARQLGHEQIDLLKIDIEGSEYDAIDDMLFTGFPVDQFAVEFDQPTPPWRTERYIAKLHGAGYHLVHVQGLNCLFVHDRVVKKVR